MVSVIIPFYNAKEYILESIRSCNNFDVISEIVVVYDGCPVLAINELNEILSGFVKVKIFFHEGFINKGAAASRNLGILHSKNEWICFLDSDDYFLPNRFDHFLELSINKVEFDGIYDPVQYFNGSNKIYGISKYIEPRKLLHFLIRGTFGHFHTNGIIVKRNLLLKAGLFVESLRLHQDADLWLKIAYYGKLIPGNLSVPVAMVRVHQGNRIWKGTTQASRYEQLKITWSWAKNENIGLINKMLIYRKLLKFWWLNRNTCPSQ